MNDIKFESDLSTKLNSLYVLLKRVEAELETAKDALQKLQAEERKEIFKNIPGISGLFDGVSMVTDTGEKFEVPVNYIAKSKLVFGDLLKLVETPDGKIFKQVEKVERKEFHAVLSKKEGGWYALSDSGSYKVSDTSCEFNEALINDEVIILVNAKNLAAPFAAIDEFLNPRKPKVEKTLKPVKKIDKDHNKSKSVSVKSSVISNTTARIDTHKIATKQEVKKVAVQETKLVDDVQNTIKTIRHLDDDDLI